ncbi:MAG: Hpt domain-containing protein [Dongiaceae bacterium]
MVTPSNFLRAKFSGGAGIDPERLIAEAEAALATLNEDYETWVGADLSRLETAFRDAQGDPDRRRELLRQAHGIAHEMKGQGTTFGYPLVTHAAGSLCRLFEAIDEVADEFALRAIELHIGGLRSIVINRIKGDGGATGRDLVAALNAVAAKASI